MEILLGIGILAALGYGAVRFAADVSTLVASDRDKTRQEQALDRRRRLAAADRERRLAMRARRQRLLSRRLQLTLIQLPSSPDFRRAAATATQAKELPVAFRQRQFRRFRTALVQHFARRLATGNSSQSMAASLRELVQALGMAGYEADYIRLEAQRSNPTPRQHVSYAQRLASAQRLHADRVAALRETPGLDTDTREQLVETELNRYREELLSLGAEPPA